MLTLIRMWFCELKAQLRDKNELNFLNGLNFNVFPPGIAAAAPAFAGLQRKARPEIYERWRPNELKVLHSLFRK